MQKIGLKINQETLELVCTLSSYDWEYVAYAYKKHKKKV